MGMEMSGNGLFIPPMGARAGLCIAIHQAKGELNMDIKQEALKKHY